MFFLAKFDHGLDVIIALVAPDLHLVHIDRHFVVFVLDVLKKTLILGISGTADFAGIKANPKLLLKHVVFNLVLEVTSLFVEVLENIGELV